MSLGSDDEDYNPQADTRNRVVPWADERSGIRSAVRLLSSSAGSMLNSAYNAYMDSSLDFSDSQLRDPSDSKLEWSSLEDSEEYEDPERILKRHPPKLLDRAATVATEVSDTDIHQALELEAENSDDTIYAEVKSHSNECKLFFDKRLNTVGLDVYRLGNKIYFDEYEATSLDELKHNLENNLRKEPEDDRDELSVFTGLLTDEEFDHFFEGAELENNCIVVKDEDSSSIFNPFRYLS